MLPPLTPGSIFARDFRIVRPLSAGGMGAVYVVEQVSTQRPRALKIMLPALVQDARMRERFTQEASVSARIRSDHVVEVVAAGIEETTQTPWLAMELLEGEDLGARLERQGRFDPSTTHEILRQLCHGLGAAHRAGLVHRDLKPANIFLASPRREGAEFVVKILDFGIAKVVDESRTMAQMTAAVGSPLWMAPEQGEQGQVRPASDVWALGLIAFALLTGRLYWRSANTEVITVPAIMREVFVDTIEPATVRAAQYGVVGVLPAGFDEWFARCLVRDVHQRFVDANEAMAALTPVLTGQTTAGGIPGPRAPTPTVGLSFPPVPVGQSIAPPSSPPFQGGGFVTPPSGPMGTPFPSAPYPVTGTQAWPSGPSAPSAPNLPPQASSSGNAALVVAIVGVGLFLGLGLVGGAYAFLRTTTTVPTPQGPIVIQNGTTPTILRVGQPVCASRNASTNIPGLTGVAQIAAGRFHTCALMLDHTLRCWGWNQSRQLGDGTTEDHNTPTMVPGINDAAQVAPGMMETCALRTDGSVLCWGMSLRGMRSSPTPVEGLYAATSITHGELHACARRTDGTVWCWGQNNDGQLGDGSTTTHVHATQVQGLPPVSQVAAGANHTCAITPDGSVWCWGRQEHGELGDGHHPREGRPVPAVVPGVAGAVEIAAGDMHTCVRLRDNTMRCWGGNDQGQLGTGSSATSYLPVAVADLTDVATFTAGYHHTCALKRDASVWCWGENFTCALGAFTMMGNNAPQRVVAAGSVMGIAGGGMHTCVRRQDGTARCWGFNQYGALGNGTTSNQADLER